MKEKQDNSGIYKGILYLEPLTADEKAELKENSKRFVEDQILQDEQRRKDFKEIGRLWNKLMP